MKNFSVLDLIDLELKEHNALELRCVAGRNGLLRSVRIPDLNRPGLALSGFFDNFGAGRMQIFGRGEQAYLEKLYSESNIATIERFFQLDFPCVIFTHGYEPSHVIADVAEANSCPVLVTDLPTSEFSARLIRALSNIFAQKETVHGVLVEVFGIGVFIQGDSGVGKSEAALELIHRGHRLVADDAVEIRCVSGNILLGGPANTSLGHHMEIRGLGIINISNLFGVGAIRDSKQIQLIVQLELWDSSKNYDRFGAEERYTNLLGVHVPSLLVPVKPGRNIPIIIETAAMNERLKKMGYNSAQEFNNTVMRWLESENARRLYQEKKGMFED